MSDIQNGTNRYEELSNAWLSFSEKQFDAWIIDFSNVFHRSNLSLKFASEILGVRIAELQAALVLAIHEEEDLALLASVVPPRTTWFSLASASTDGLLAAVEALNSAREGSPFLQVEEAIRAISGPSSLERVSSLSSDAFGQAFKKAEAYDVLSTKSRQALKNFQTSQRTGKGLTSKQAAYAKSLLEQLIAEGVIVRNSKDGDERICDEILDAIGGD